MPEWPRGEGLWPCMTPRELLRLKRGLRRWAGDAGGYGLALGQEGGLL